MSLKKLSDEATAEACGKAAEKIITSLVLRPPLTVTLSEEDARKWGFPDLASMRLTMEEFTKALPPAIRHQLVIKEATKP